MMSELFISPLHCALITGASQGIGLACAKQLAQQGCPHLILSARRLERLKAIKVEIEHEFPNTRVSVYDCDHSQTDHVVRFAEQLTQSETCPDAIIANVGVNPLHQNGPKRAFSTSVQTLLDTFQTNVANTHALLAPFLKRFKKHGGRVVLVGSQAYQYGVKGQLAYNVSKAALVGYQNTLMSELITPGFYCHLVNPGVVNNLRTQALRANSPELACVSESDVAACICDALCQSEQTHLVINI